MPLALLVGALAACGTDPSPIAIEEADPTRSATAPRPSQPEAATVSIAAVGDVMFARTVGEAMVEGGLDAAFAGVGDTLREADIAFANLEMALTERGEPAPKDFTFRAPPSFGPALVGAGIDVVSLANNHIMDYGPEGLFDTLVSLELLGVKGTGAGASREAAVKPAIVESKGIRVAFLAFASCRNDSVSGFEARSFEAGETTPGIAWAEVDRITQAVRDARAQADVVVVSFHWGDEYRHEVSEEQQALAYTAVDSGAQLVLGHGPHVLQGWEARGEALIVYSLGNFVFDLDDVDRSVPGLPSVNTLVLQVEVGPSGTVSASYVPVLIDEATGFPHRAEGPEELRVRQLVEALSPTVADAVAALQLSAQTRGASKGGVTRDPVAAPGN
ncbi:MAG TPA: CapA family protein [Dehalococcoidia bacterium]|nr:CapA family protein [Dehalococcoidia bacterium]